jgi:hypothetical protein
MEPIFFLDKDDGTHLQYKLNIKDKERKTWRTELSPNTETRRVVTRLHDDTPKSVTTHCKGPLKIAYK